MAVTMETEHTEVPPFEFKNSHLGNRCKDVFSCLDELESKHQAFERTRALEDAEEDERLVKQGPSQADMETISPAFKPPMPTRGRHYQNRQGGRHSHERTGSHLDCRQAEPRSYESRGRPYRRGQGRGWKTPDYKLHPERWTEYSLEDVDVSDAANRQAAFDFLQERRAVRDSEMKEESVDLDSNACSKGLITFKKPMKKKQKSETATSESKQKTVERNDFNEDGNNDIDMGEPEGSTSDVQKNLKRKLDPGDGDTEMTASQTDSLVSFKSRKVAKKNIRSRQRHDDNDDSD